jgi:hypothetical protein
MTIRLGIYAGSVYKLRCAGVLPAAQLPAPASASLRPQPAWTPGGAERGVGSGHPDSPAAPRVLRRWPLLSYELFEKRFLRLKRLIATARAPAPERPAVVDAGGP